MAKFFIDRPVFAWVIAVVIMLAGGIAAFSLPIEQYPTIAPPSVVINATYPGADSESLQNSVTQVIEQQLTGIDNLLYFSSTSSSAGQATIKLTFATGTNPDIAQVQVQNKVTLAQPLLPNPVIQQGVTVAKASPDILMFVALQSDNPSIDGPRLSDILASQIQPAIGRVSGVGTTTLLGSEYAMRIWLDPDKLQAYGLSTTQVLNAVNSQNAQFAAGSLGSDPAVNGQVFTATVSGDALFSTRKQFEDIVLLANNNGTVVRLGDVARITFGAQTYGERSVFNGKPAGGLAIFLLPGANALSVASAVKAQMASLARDLPTGVTWSVPYDTSPFITASIADVVRTLAEAIGLGDDRFYAECSRQRFPEDVFQHGVNDDGNARRIGPEKRGSLDPVHSRHGEIQGNEVGMDGGGFFESFRAVGSFAANLVAMMLEKRANGAANGGFVFYDKNALCHYRE